MSKRKFNQLVAEFDQYIEEKSVKSNVQCIIWFYIFIRKEVRNQVSTGYQFPWDRHVRVAKKIDDWVRGSLGKAQKLIWDMKIYFEEEELEWTLDTVYQYVPKYAEGYIAKNHLETDAEDDEMYQRQRERLDSRLENEEISDKEYQMKIKELQDRISCW